jgi:radical SAM protein with 4Fe4S-binding SPASM domain
MSSSITLVLPLEEDLIQSFTNYHMVVKLTNSEQIKPAVEMVARQNQLESIWFQNHTVMSDISFSEENKKIPIVYQIDEMGDFKKLAGSFELIKAGKYQFYFKLNTKNCTSVQMLSSLGVPAGLDFITKGMPDWDKLTDLAVYNVYNKIKHAPIEPFNYIVEHYRIDNYTFFEPLFFFDPQKYLHLNNKGEVAFSDEDLRKKNICNITLDQISELPKTIDARKVKEEYRSHLLDFDECSTCEVFRICKGSFSTPGGCDEGCQIFFKELMDSAEKLQQNKKEK